MALPQAVHLYLTWWRHPMETFSALLALCAGNSPVTGEFPSQRPMTRSFHVFFHLRLNKRLSKQSWGWLFETPPGSLWRHCNGKGLQIYVPLRKFQRMNLSYTVVNPLRAPIVCRINLFQVQVQSLSSSSWNVGLNATSWARRRLDFTQHARF